VSKDKEGVRAPGLFESVRAMLASLVAIAHTRLDLFGAEIEEQIDRLAAIVVWWLIGLFLGFFALLFACIALIVVFWDTHRVLVTCGLAGLFAALAAYALYGFFARVRARPRLFSSTLDELARDHERLRDE
jgi:uncharacterized membrane protein YqjE